MPRLATQDSEGNLRITVQGELKELRFINGVSHYYDGPKNYESLKQINFPNGEKIFFEGEIGKEKIIKKYVFSFSNAEDYHVTHYKGDFKKEYLHKIELFRGGEIIYDKEGNITSYNLTNKQLQFFMEEIKYLHEKIVHLDSIVQNFYRNYSNTVLPNKDTNLKKRKNESEINTNTKRNKSTNTEINICSDTIFIS